MRALLADLSARWRSSVGSILDRSGDLCTRLWCWCFAARERLAPSPVDLTPAAADRILSGVMARISDAATVQYQPTAIDRACASLAKEGLVVRTIQPDGSCHASILPRPVGRA